MTTVLPASRVESTPKTGVRGWAVLALLFAFYVINFADKSVLGLAAEPIMRELEITPTQYGLVSSAFFFVFSLSALAVGFLVDSFRTKPVLFIMAMVWTVAQALILAPIGGLLALVASRMLLGAGEGPAFGVTNHAAMKWFPPEKRSLAVTGVALGTPIGTMVAIPILSWVISGYSWQAAFAGLAFASLLWAIVWAIVGREGPFVEKAPAASAGSRPARRLADYLRVLRAPSFIGVLVAGIASYWSVTLLLAWVPPYLSTTAGYSQAETAGYTMGAWLVQAVAIFLVVGLASTYLTKRGVATRWSRGVLGGSMVLLSGLAMLGFYLTPTGPLSMVFMVLAFGLSACIIPMSQAVISEITPPGTRGGILGVYTAVYSLTGVVAPALTGFLVDVSATPQAGFSTVFMVSSVLLIVAGLMCITMTNPQRDAERMGLTVKA
jgi:predicted MFS family arabinose efflux permease